MPSADQNGLEAREAERERVAGNDRRELAIAEAKGSPDVYVDAERDTAWVPWHGSIEFKPLRFEARNGMYVIVLRTAPHAELGRHRHRGEVRAYTVRGRWGYHEHDWEGKPGDYITEAPGTIHTLYMGEQCEVMFNTVGSIEFFNDDGALREIMDLFSFWRMYVDHCEALGVKPNEGLWY